MLDQSIEGTTAVAAVRTGRHYVGFDTDAAYIAIAEQRIAEERGRLKQPTDRQQWKETVAPSANGASPTRLFEHSDDEAASKRDDHDISSNGADPAPNFDFQARAGQEGRKAREMARAVLEERGFSHIQEKIRFSCGVEINFEAVDQQGRKWLFGVSGAFSITQRPGLRRTDTLWKALGKAAVLHAVGQSPPLVLLTTDRPAPNSGGHRALAAVTGPDKPVFDVIGILDPRDLERLADLASGQS